MSLSLREAGKKGTVRCPYCLDNIPVARVISRCSKCKTAHHEACWDEHLRCSVFGCNGTAEAVASEDFVIEEFQRRRKRLLKCWLAPVMATAIVFAILIPLLQNIMPMFGRILFAAIVSGFFTILLMSFGYAQYLCPGCGRTPSVTWKTRHRVQETFWESRFVEVQHRSMDWNPLYCPDCKIKLR